MVIKMLKARTKDNPYTYVFNEWVSSLPPTYPSAVDSDGRALRGAITLRDTYSVMWREMNTSNWFPADIETREVDTSPAKQTTNLWDLVRILERMSPNDTYTVSGRGKGTYNSQDVADAIKRRLGGVSKPVKTADSLAKDFRDKLRFLEEFTVALKPPADFNPNEAKEGEMPYRLGERNVGELMSEISRKELLSFENIYLAEGGKPKSEQKAYDIDFDSQETDQRIRNAWTKLRIMLGNPNVKINNIRGEKQEVATFDYYTLEFEEKSEPLFVILKYIYNKFGKGRSGKRYFSQKTQKDIRDALKERRKGITSQSPSPQLRGDIHGGKKQKPKKRPTSSDISANIAAQRGIDAAKESGEEMIYDPKLGEFVPKKKKGDRQ